MQTEERIETLIEPVLEAMGYALVRVQISDAPNAVLQVMAERHDGKGMTVDDCARISREISTILDVEDPIELAYALEVSSPGIDRPLVTLADFERFAGYDVRIDLKQDMAGQRRFRGRLESVSGEAIDPAASTKLATGETVHFCCGGCIKKFNASPASYVKNLEKQHFYINLKALEKASKSG